MSMFVGGKCRKCIDGQRARQTQSYDTRTWFFVHLTKSYVKLQLNMSKHVPYQNIRSLVHICRKLAANLRQVCSTQLRQVCRKRVFRMQITFLAHCSGIQCAPQVCSAQLSRTVLVHNVCRKFAAHSCRTLFLCATSLRHTVAKFTRQSMFVKHVPPLWAYFMEATKL